MRSLKSVGSSSPIRDPSRRLLHSRYRLTATDLRAWATISLCAGFFLIQTANARPRVSILILPPYCESTNSTLAHWQYTLAFLLKDQLRQVDQIRIPPDSNIEFGIDDSVEFAQHELHGTFRNEVRDIVKMGRIVEAQWVLWSAYECRSSGWRWTARLADVRRGTSKPPWLAANSDSPWGVVCEMRKAILERFRIRPSQDELLRMDRKITTSVKALELTSTAFYDEQNVQPVSSAQKALHSALELDPQFRLAREALAYSYVIDNQPEEAGYLLQPIVAAGDGSARTHEAYGLLLGVEGLNALAAEQLRMAHEKAPNDPLPLIHLAQVLGPEGGHWEQAVALLNEALKIEPYSALAHEELALAEAHLGNRGLANKELAACERYDLGREGMLMLKLGEAYSMIGNLPRAIANYDRFVSGAARIGLQVPGVDYAEKQLAQLRLRLKPHFITATEPRTFTPPQLAAFLQSTLGASFGHMSWTNPLQTDRSMLKWAKNATRGAMTDIDKARSLFDAVTERFDLGTRTHQRTAKEAAADWKNPLTHLTCEDYTFLYVALAREVGLPAFCVLINRDCQSNLVSHACAGVFIGSQALLVDPGYQWFGAPHLEYQFLDDAEALGVYFMQSTNLEYQEAAVKVWPRSARPRFWLAPNLAWQGRMNEAQQMLESGLKMDGVSWRSFFARGGVALYAKDTKGAITNFERCLQFHPLFAEIHYFLGAAYREDGRLTEALDEYRAYIEEGDDPSLLDWARDKVAQISTKLETQDKSQNATGRLELHQDPSK